MDFTFTSAMCRYGDLWRRKRRALRKYVSPRTAPTYREVQMREARAFCDKLLARPEDFIAEIEQCVFYTYCSPFWLVDEGKGMLYIRLRASCMA